MGKLIDLTGKRFGRLTVIERVNGTVVRGKSPKVFWRCKCDCGNIREIDGYSLRSGNTQSCGCIFMETITKHGGYGERLYKIWSQMKERCNNPHNKHYSYYGGKGVAVCEEWTEYAPFRDWSIKNGYSGGLSIDRIDPNKGYSPDNCRWITISENSRKASKKHIITVNGISKNCAEWETSLNLGRNAVTHWIKRHGEDYAIKKIDARMNPENYDEKEFADPSFKRWKYLTVNGETLPYSTWSRKIGMSPSTVKQWVDNRGEEYAIDRIKAAIREGG